MFLPFAKADENCIRVADKHLKRLVEVIIGHVSSSISKYHTIGITCVTTMEFWFNIWVHKQVGTEAQFLDKPLSSRNTHEYLLVICIKANTMEQAGQLRFGLLCLVCEKSEGDVCRSEPAKGSQQCENAISIQVSKQLT